MRLWRCKQILRQVYQNEVNFFACVRACACVSCLETHTKAVVLHRSDLISLFASVCAGVCVTCTWSLPKLIFYF